MRFVIRSGANKDAACEYIRKLRIQPTSAVDITELEESLTGEMRGYWHVLLHRIANAIGEPYGTVKTTIKVRTLGLDVEQDLDGTVHSSVPSSEKQSRKVYSRLIDYTLRYAAEELGIVLPDPRR